MKSLTSASNKKARRKLKARIGRAFALIGLILFLTLTLMLGGEYWHKALDVSCEYAYSCARMAASFVDANRIQAYLQTGIKDTYYTDVESSLRAIVNATGFNDCFVAAVAEDGLIFVWDADNSASRNDLGSMSAYVKNERKAIQKASETDKQELFLNKSPWGGLRATAYLPLHNDSGETAAIVGVDMSLDEINAGSIRFVLVLAMSVLLITVLAIIGFYVYADVRLINPYETLTKESERLSVELDLARRIQENMLPRIFPPYPARTEFDLFGCMLPAKEVGGDFYDFFLLDEDHLCIDIGDVSGKGVPAALFMMVSKTVIKNGVCAGLSPEEVFTRANTELTEGNEEGLFTTAWLGIYEISTGKLFFSDAGHENPLVRHANGSVDFLKPVKKRLMLAGMENTEYLLSCSILDPGDTLLLYTDGVPESCSPDGEFYGTERMKAAAAAANAASPKDLVEAVRSDVLTFAKGEPPFDDLTMLALSIKKEPHALVLTASDENLCHAQSFVRDRLSPFIFDSTAIERILVCVEEIFINIAHYAYTPDVGAVVLRCVVLDEGRKAAITFSDSGRPFNPLEGAMPDTTAEAAERPIGGLGIHMVRKLMDDVKYAYISGHNVLTLTKELTQADRRENPCKS